MCSNVKTHYLKIIKYAEILSNINKYIPLFLGLENQRNMEEEYMKNIPLHLVPNRWIKQAYPQGFKYDSETFRVDINPFNNMEISKKIY